MTARDYNAEFKDSGRQYAYQFDAVLRHYVMRSLDPFLPPGKALGWHENPVTLEPREIAASLRGGDVVVVKGSKKMFWVNKFVPRLIAALQARVVK